jgi:hypothetical protein
MKGRQYDLEKLDASGKFDTTTGRRLHYDTQAYFDSLTNFSKNFKKDLRNYTPAFVVNSDEDRDRLLRECFEIRAEFMQLGMVALMDTLTVMEDAAREKNAKEFADGQKILLATLDICKKAIAEAAKPWRVTRR